MLKIKYFKNLEDPEGLLLMSGNKQDYKNAYLFFREKMVAHLVKQHKSINEELMVSFILNDPEICTYYPTPIIFSKLMTPNLLEIGLKEMGLAVEYFASLSLMESGHYSLYLEYPLWSRLKISLNEYDDKIFEEESIC